MDNKQVIEKLTEYFMTQDKHLIARGLAGAQLDFYRYNKWDSLPTTELVCLHERTRLMAEEFEKFVRNGPDGDLKIVTMDSSNGLS
jgi:hypothetical protein